MSDTLSRDFQYRAHQVIPGGAHTYSRGDDQYPSNAPAVLERGLGARVWDPDGNSFVDYGMALRAVTLGYCREEVETAALSEIKKGNTLTRASTTEILAAEQLVSHFPWADMVKFCKSGSTATSAAVKLARAHTGRKIIARCSDHPFFSYDDWFIGSTVVNSGIPEEIQNLTKMFGYNDLASLEKLFAEYPGQIACVILEPAVRYEPKVVNGENFLQAIRRLCTKHGAVMILDEMITGFRWHLSGAMKLYNVEPDLATFGKALGNGFSVSALVGKKEIMELGGIHHDRDRVFLVSTTHGAEMCGLGAMMASLKIYQSEPVIEKIWSYGKKLIDGVTAEAKNLGIEKLVGIDGIACSPVLFTKDQKGQDSMVFRTLLSQELIRGGILMPWIALSSAHGEKELEQTMTAFRAGFQVYAKALESDPMNFLKGPVMKPVFRRKN